MLEFGTIQQKGFRNVTNGKKITGFQVPIRLTGYRGLWLSQIRKCWVAINGEKFDESQITWVVNGKSYKLSEFQNYPNVNWQRETPALLQINKSGGLPMGIYDVEVKYTYTTSYIPPAMDDMPDDAVGGFGASEPYKRRMTLVR